MKPIDQSTRVNHYNRQIVMHVNYETYMAIIVIYLIEIIYVYTGYMYIYIYMDIQLYPYITITSSLHCSITLMIISQSISP